MKPVFRLLINRWIARHAASGLNVNAKDAHLHPAVLVTGGSSGIGLAIAHVFHNQGETVVLVARDDTRLAAALSGFPHPTAAPRVFTLALDVTAADALDRIDATLDALGLTLDILVNAAGEGLAGHFYSHNQAAIDHLLAINVDALTRLTRHFLPQMIARARGGILNVASLGGYVPGPGQAAYYASKAYVCSLTEAIAAEIAGSGVRITVVAPGPVATTFHAAMGADHSLYRWLLPAISPERVATAAVTGYHWGRTVVVPGLVPKMLAVAVAVLPHAVTLPLVRLLLALR